MNKPYITIPAEKQWVGCVFGIDTLDEYNRLVDVCWELGFDVSTKCPDRDSVSDGSERDLWSMHLNMYIAWEHLNYLLSVDSCYSIPTTVVVTISNEIKNCVKAANDSFQWYKKIAAEEVGADV